MVKNEVIARLALAGKVLDLGFSDGLFHVPRLSLPGKIGVWIGREAARRLYRLGWAQSRLVHVYGLWPVNRLN
jgi:hypothetical protein